MPVFLDGEVEHSKKVIGGKAYGLNNMMKYSLPVPPAFVCPTSHTFDLDFEGGDKFVSQSHFGLSLYSAIRHLAQKEEKNWGANNFKPLVVSVRSGAPVSMPGMMDTILNIGLTRNNLAGFVLDREATMAFALDCYRRLIQMFAVTVHGIDDKKFTEIYAAAKTYYGELNEEAYQILVNLFEEIYKEEVGEPFPEDPHTQLLGAVNAVYASYWSEKAVSYRDIEGLDHKMGTAVTVQPMIFGNLEDSATGVAFTHNPNTGQKGIYGDFLKGAQGEDVVSGAHKVLPIKEIFKDPALVAPARDLQGHMSALLQREKDILDIEFTIERGKLYILQYRVAKRSHRASVRSILDMTRDGEISSDAATQRFMSMLPKAETGTKDPGSLKYVGAGMGVTENEVIGKIATSKKIADEYAAANEPYVLCATETNPNDVAQMKNAVGILTSTGGSLSHAAVVARGWGKSCVVSFEDMTVNKKGILINEELYEDGSLIKINGSTGEVWA